VNKVGFYAAWSKGMLVELEFLKKPRPRKSLEEVRGMEEVRSPKRPRKSRDRGDLGSINNLLKFNMLPQIHSE